MDWVIDDVAIGNCLEAQDAGLLRATGIASVLCLDRTLQGRTAADLGLSEIVGRRLSQEPFQTPVARYSAPALSPCTAQNRSTTANASR